MKTVGFLLALLSGAIMSTVVFLWIAAGEIYDYQDTFELGGKPIDVVLCLAGGKRRIPIAIDVWEKVKVTQGPPPALFLSGVGPKAGFETLVEQGVSRERVNQLRKDNVIFENVSENTFENAQIFATFARQHKWKHVLLVTAGYHVRRSQFILHRALDSDVRIDTFTVDAIHFDRNQWHKDVYAVRVTIIEYIKWLYYRYSY